MIRRKIPERWGEPIRGMLTLRAQLAGTEAPRQPPLADLDRQERLQAALIGLQQEWQRLTEERR